LRDPKANSSNLACKQKGRGYGGRNFCLLVSKNWQKLARIKKIPDFQERNFCSK